MPIIATALSFILASSMQTVPVASGDWGGNHQGGNYARVEQSGSKIKVICLKANILGERYLPGDVIFEGLIAGGGPTTDDWSLKGRALYRLDKYEREHAPGSQDFYYETTGMFHSSRLLTNGMLEEYLVIFKKWYKPSGGKMVFEKQSGDFFLRRIRKPGPPAPAARRPAAPRAALAKQRLDPPPSSVSGVFVVDDGLMPPFAKERDIKDVLRREARHRHLFVYGVRLPGRGDSIRIDSGDPGIRYSVIETFPSYSYNNPYGAHWRIGLQKMAMRENLDDKRASRYMSAVLLEVTVPNGTMSGSKTFRLNGLEAQWLLPTSSMGVSARIVRPLANGQWEQVDAVYLPDRFAVEVETTHDSPGNSVSVVLQLDGQSEAFGDLSSVNAQKVSGKLFRTAVFEMVHPDLPPPAREDGILYQAARNGQQLRATVRHTSGFMRSAVASAQIIDSPAEVSADWRRALVIAAEHAELQIPRDPRALNSAVATNFASLSVFDLWVAKEELNPLLIVYRKVSGQPIISSTTVPVRLTEIKVGDHAAMILMRHAFIRALDAHVADIEAMRISEAAEGVAKLVQELPADHPLCRAMGSSSMSASNLTMRQAFQKSRLDTMSNSDRTKWTREFVASGLTNYLRPTRRALEIARNTSQTDIKALLRLTGRGFGNIERQLIPRMMTDVDAQGRPLARWMPDTLARQYVQGVGYLYQQFVANEKVGEADTQLLLAVSALIPFAAVPMGLSRVAVSLAVGALDLGDFLAEQLPAAIRSWQEVEFARDASAVLDGGRLTQAEANSRSYVGTILAGVASVIGVKFDMIEVVARTRSASALRRIGAFLDNPANAQKRATDALGSLELQGKIDLVASGRAAFQKAALEGIASLTARERVAYDFMRKLIHEVQGLKQGDALLGAKAPASQVMSDVCEVAAADARGARTVAVKPSTRPKPDIPGVKLDDCIGGGAYCDTYLMLDAAGGYKKQVMKFIFGQGDRNLTESALEKLNGVFDDFSTSQQILERMLVGQGHLARAKIPHLPMLNPVAEGFVRYEQMLITVGDNLKLFSAADKLPPDIQKAVLELYKKLADNRLIWADAHVENMYFKLVNGKWEAGILDPDFIISWGQRPGTNYFAERLAKLEGAPGNVGIGSLSGRTGFASAIAGGNHLTGVRQFESPEYFMMKMLERFGFIKYNVEDVVPGSTMDQAMALWEGRKLDLNLVKDYFPNFMESLSLGKSWNGTPVIRPPGLIEFFDNLMAGAKPMGHRAAPAH